MKNMLPAAVQHCKSGLYLSVILNRAAAADWTEQKHHRWQKLDCGSPRPTSNTQQRPVKNNSSSELMQISPINLCELTLSPSLPLFLYPWVYTVLHSLSISLMNVWWCCQLLTKSEGGTCSCSQTQGWHCVFLSFLFFFLPSVDCWKNNISTHVFVWWWKKRTTLVIRQDSVRRVMTELFLMYRKVIVLHPNAANNSASVISIIFHKWSVGNFPSHANHPNYVFVHRHFIS